MSESDSSIKFCNTCQTFKDVSEFGIRKSKNRSKLYLNSRCKSCDSVYLKAYHLKNKAKHNAHSKAKYYENHEENKAKFRESIRANPENNRRKASEYYWANQEDVRAKSREYRKVNNEKVNRQRSKIKGELHKLKFEYLADKCCAECGFSDPICLQFDHLRDKYKAISAMIAEEYSWDEILKEIDKCQILCCSCHFAKTKYEVNAFAYMPFGSRLKQAVWDERYSRGMSLYTKRESPKVINAYLYLEKILNGCSECGCKKILSLQFDHIDRKDKSVGGVSKLCAAGASEQKLQEEIEKCRVVCANCHIKRTSKQLNWHWYM